jgi:hypothetical protein
MMESLADKPAGTMLREIVELEVPDEFLQFTYGELRIAPDGEPLAVYGDNHGGDGWTLAPSPQALAAIPTLGELVRDTFDAVYPFSDIVVIP